MTSVTVVQTKYFIVASLAALMATNSVCAQSGAPSHDTKPKTNVVRPKRMGLATFRDSADYKEGKRLEAEGLKDLRAGHPAEAERNIGNATKLMDQDGWAAWERLGDEYKKQGQIDKAVFSYRKAKALTYHKDVQRNLEKMIRYTLEEKAKKSPH